MKSPIDLLESLFLDLKRLNPDVKGLERDFVTLEKRYEDEGYGFLTVALPALDSAVLNGLSIGRFACPPGFKPIRGGAIPKFLSGMLCNVFEPSSGVLKDQVDDCVLKSVRNLLMFFKKMKLSPEHEEILHVKAVSTFYECDEVAGSVVIQSRILCHLQRVAKVILPTLETKLGDNMTFKHGPGGVEEKLCSNQKWEELSKGLVKGLFDLDAYGFDVQTHRHFIYTDSRLREMTAPPREGTAFEVHRKPIQLSLFDEPTRSCARLVTVLKNSSARRTITVEPMLNQFVQQGLNNALREAIPECAILRNSLALSDQTANQKLALEGSLTDEWATLDLKSASDLLSVKLVEAVFGSHGLFLDHILDCRSKEIYSDQKDRSPLLKFAGMGNATTFPVQSVCFAAISIAAILDSWGLSPSYRNCLRASRLVRVYGDDIIIAREHARQCVNWLHACGLTVNSKKSFLEGNFKESCGVDAFRGIDITPLYIKHCPATPSTDPNIIAGFVSLSNHLWMEGLYSASTALKEEVESRLRRTLPLVRKESGLLGWHSRIDSTNAHKWCKRTHQLLVRALALAPVYRSDPISGYAALLKYFVTSRVDGEGQGSLANYLGRILYPMDKDPDHLSRTPIRFKSRIKSTWVPAR